MHRITRCLLAANWARATPAHNESRQTRFAGFGTSGFSHKNPIPSGLVTAQAQTNQRWGPWIKSSFKF